MSRDSTIYGTESDALAACALREETESGNDQLGDPIYTDHDKCQNPSDEVQIYYQERYQDDSFQCSADVFAKYIADDYYQYFYNYNHVIYPAYKKCTYECNEPDLSNFQPTGGDCPYYAGSVGTDENSKYSEIICTCPDSENNQREYGLLNPNWVDPSNCPTGTEYQDVDGVWQCAPPPSSSSSSFGSSSNSACTPLSVNQVSFNKSTIPESECTNYYLSPHDSNFNSALTPVSNYYFSNTHWDSCRDECVGSKQICPAFTLYDFAPGACVIPRPTESDCPSPWQKKSINMWSSADSLTGYGTDICNLSYYCEETDITKQFHVTCSEQLGDFADPNIIKTQDELECIVKNNMHWKEDTRQCVCNTNYFFSTLSGDCRSAYQENNVSEPPSESENECNAKPNMHWDSDVLTCECDDNYYYSSIDGKCQKNGEVRDEYLCNNFTINMEWNGLSCQCKDGFFPISSTGSNTYCTKTNDINSSVPEHSQPSENSEKYIENNVSTTPTTAPQYTDDNTTNAILDLENTVKQLLNSDINNTNRLSSLLTNTNNELDELNTNQNDIKSLLTSVSSTLTEWKEDGDSKLLGIAEEVYKSKVDITSAIREDGEETRRTIKENSMKNSIDEIMKDGDDKGISDLTSGEGFKDGELGDIDTELRASLDQFVITDLFQFNITPQLPDTSFSCCGGTYEFLSPTFVSAIPIDLLRGMIMFFAAMAGVIQFFRN